MSRFYMPCATSAKAMTAAMTTAMTIALACAAPLTAGCGDDSAPAPSAPDATPPQQPIDAGGGDAGAPVVVDPAGSLPDEVLYFVLVDRFSNGDPENDLGAPGTPSGGAFGPADPLLYHGGDLAGLIDKLDYIQGMGVTALWVNPMFANRALQGSSAAYHGYWGLDFMNVDPHWGGNQDFHRLVDEAHARGLKVYLDIITNHTADVIYYDECSGCSYRPLDQAAYTPRVDAALAAAKSPAWLNDVSLYNNRGDSTFSGESAVYGDFYGLDDLDTRKPEVIDGMIEIYKHWITEFDVDGFRIDTVKHVDIELWQAFGPALLEHAARAGKPHFSMFGEVFDYQPENTSRYTTEGRLPSVLDFPLQGAVRQVFSQNGPTSALRALFASDDVYTDGDSDARSLVGFLGNHDMGRIGQFLQSDDPNRGDAENLARAQLAHALLFFARGAPVIYYGDEQGFTGDGDGDTSARQDMMASQVGAYQDDDNIGTASTPADENFDPTHPLYQAISAYAAVFKAHAALRRGVQLHRYSQDSAGMLALSRILTEPLPGFVDQGDEDSLGVEYLVVLNSHTDVAQASVPTGTPDAQFSPVFHSAFDDAADAPALTSGADGSVQTSLPGLSVAVYRADKSAQVAPASATLTITEPSPNARIRERVQVAAELSGDGLAGVRFEASVDGAGFQSLGTDWSAPYQVTWIPSEIAGRADVSFRAVLVTPEPSADPPRSDEVRAVLGGAPPASLIVHYENGAARTHAVLLGQDGSSSGPLALIDGSVEFPLPTDESDYLLIFEDRDQDSFGFDRPLLLSADALSGFIQEPTEGAPFIEVFINNDGALAATDNALGSGTPASLPAVPDAPPPFGTETLYLRGTMNDWTTNDAMTYVGGGAYRATVTLSPGDLEFKFADANWSEPTNFGGPYRGEGLSIGGGSSNLQHTAAAAGEYEFYLFSLADQGGAVLRFHHVIAPNGL